MKSTLLYLADGQQVALRRPIGFARKLEVEAARPEEWSPNYADRAEGTLVGYPAWADAEARRRPKAPDR